MTAPDIDELVERLEKALEAASGYMRNAVIDLATGPKRRAAATLDDGLKIVDAALNESRRARAQADEDER